MKIKKVNLLIIFVLIALVLFGCVRTDTDDSSIFAPSAPENPFTPSGPEPPLEPPTTEGSSESIETGSFDESVGEDLSESPVYDGYFEEETKDIVVTCVSGTKGAYTLSESTLTFTSLSEDSVYSVSGKLNGNIVIDIGDNYKLDLELQGFSLVSESAVPVFVSSGSKVSITAKKDFESYIYDNRDAVDEADETSYSGAIHSLVDLEICGKGKLTIVSKNNNGIHSKDDLEVKNLTLSIVCKDNALKGNDSVTIEGGKSTLIATQGDGIKTTNSDISEKGNQRGTVSITGGSHTIYAACDGIDAAYNVLVDDESTSLSIYTDKYSTYSDEITAVENEIYYIRYSKNTYSYSIKYYNSDTDYVWVNASYHSMVSGGRSSYYYYSLPKKSEYSKLKLFIYSSDMEQGQESNYVACSDYMSLNESYDTIALSSRGSSSLSYSWTNYTTSAQGGMGGMQEGNTDKGDHSTKGIKACNEIQILNGSIAIKAYDDAIHANADATLENGEAPTGNVILSSGTISAYSNDDGIHADGSLTISGGTVAVSNSYEGLEGFSVTISGGDVSVISSDDGINSTTTQGTGISISGGKLYVLAGGDGVDSNSKTSYSGIIFSGGSTAIISTSNGNSAIDTEQGYSHTGGLVVAIMPSGGMTSESTNCSNFSSIGTKASLSLNANSYLMVTANSQNVVTIKMPKSISGVVVYLGSSSANISSSTSCSEALDSNGVCWK